MTPDLELVDLYHDLATGITSLRENDPRPEDPNILRFTVPDDIYGDLLFEGMSLDEALEYAQHLNPAARRYLSQRHNGGHTL